MCVYVHVQASVLVGVGGWEVTDSLRGASVSSTPLLSVSCCRIAHMGAPFSDPS